MKDVILVAGMHRCGTSCITELLGKLGCEIGSSASFLAPNSANPRGYFENKSIVEFNNLLLSSKTTSHTLNDTKIDELLTIHSNAWISAAENGYEESNNDLAISKRIRSYFSDFEKGSDLIILKDPRFCLTLDFWRKLISVKAVIIPVRKIDSVIHSLEKRDNLSPALIEYLWFSYYKSLISRIGEIPYHIICYERLLDDTGNEIEKMFSFLDSNEVPGLDYNPDISFIDEKLNHHKDEDTVQSEIYTTLVENRCFDTALLERLGENQNLAREKFIDTALAHDRQQRLTVEKKTQSLNRLNNHIIIGSLIRLFRWIKKDDSFGG